MSRWSLIQDRLKPGGEIVLLVHEKPDGDCLGSALGLGLFLKEQGYRPVLYLPKPVPELYRFMPGQELIKIVEKGAVPEHTPIIAVDCGDTQRWEYQIPSSSQLLNIDHHISNTMFGVVNIVDPKASATGEILYELMIEAGGTVSADMATCLYVAVNTDTGSFRYSNVAAKTFRIAGELVAAGADLNLVRNELFEKRPLVELLTMKNALENLTFTSEGKIASAQLPYEVLRRDNLQDPDTDGLIGMMRATEGVELALLFKELEPNLVKVSFRSKSFVDSNKLAQHFQGGGHPRAAGCTIKGQLAETAEKVMQLAREAITEGNSNERSH